MNNKAQMAGVGVFIMLFVGVIVALAIFNGGITSNVGSAVNTIDVPITTQVTFPTNSTELVLNGKSVSSVVVINGSQTVGSGNYSITNNDISASGVLQSTIIAVGASPYQGANVNISYTYEPLGYVSDSGSRAIVSLIIIFSALAIAGFVINKIYEDGLMAFGK